jgi:glycine dehydrogenase subunit 1
MPFIPHTEADISAMLAAIGADSIEALFDEIPASLRCGELSAVPEAMSEMSVTRHMHELAAKDGGMLNFIGAGAYEHHIPAAVWQIVSRGEFYSAYTPYQAEASQGTLQVIYEYQSMMTALTGMDVSNASLYDGASALAEAMLMAIRCNRKSKSRKILIPESLHPAYRDTAFAIVKNQNIELVSVAVEATTGRVDPATLAEWEEEDIAALVIPQPNFFGVLEDVDELTDWAAANNTISIAVVNPLTLAILKPPGEWGEAGADIVCGDGQPLGAPLSSGGPYYGLLCCKQQHVRQMPGRIVGRTLDADGKTGFVLTLQAREQHIRRSKATSNICTNQGLLVTASTIHMALMGPQGLQQVAEQCYANTHRLIEMLAPVGVKPVHSAEFFHECLIDVGQPAEAVLAAMQAQGVLGGYAVGKHYPGMQNAILVCATETKIPADLQAYVSAMQAALKH